jgi:hypothetical protein
LADLFAENFRLVWRQRCERVGDIAFISFCLISFDKSTAKIAKIVEHDVDDDIIG